MYRKAHSLYFSLFDLSQRKKRKKRKKNFEYWKQRKNQLEVNQHDDQRRTQKGEVIREKSGVEVLLLFMQACKLNKFEIAVGGYTFFFVVVKETTAKEPASEENGQVKKKSKEKKKAVEIQQKASRYNFAHTRGLILHK
jgi:hypothetical protein